MDLVDLYGNQGDKGYLRLLLQKAEEYNRFGYFPIEEFDEVSFFYRNKPEDYFLEVKRNNNVLKKIRKDFNGDPKSPINGRLDGVFLSVTLFRGDLPTISPFGDTRVHIPIEAVFRESTNLYFTDFYCTTSSTHYVTLVLTQKWSSEDLFCQRTLLKLDPMKNPFLRMCRRYLSQPTFTTIQRSALHVEVFYTADIDLNELLRKYGPGKVFFKKTGIIGRGHSTPGGLRKNSLCILCNPPVQTPRPPAPYYAPVETPRRQALYASPVQNPRHSPVHDPSPVSETSTWKDWVASCTIL